ncbi:hypothetical protein SEPCBS119000_002196 [Sporothrix epigloea]|uniref:Pre-mRNA-splicing factor n=1 Tax=Sporothrix epigloea TaxID=1892477 RepID=A0ABP0DEV2_9PEZI
MPPAKKLKSLTASKARASRAAEEPPAAPIPNGDTEFMQLAKQNWLKGGKRATKVKVKNAVIKDGIWDVLEKEGFTFKSLLSLETLQILESYLWPGYTEDASDIHILLIVLITGAKRREHLDTWGVFAERPLDFSSFFRRTLTMSLDATLALTVRTRILSFIIHAFQSLECAIVRKECAPLVSIGIWHNIADDAKRDELLDQATHLRKAWRAAAKRFDAVDDEAKARLRFDRSWLYSLVLDFVGVLFDEATQNRHAAVLYCERFVEFLVDLQSQLPTRRYVNALLQDLHVLPALSVSPLFNDEDNGLLRDLTALLAHYTYFNVDDQTGAQLSETEAYDRECARLAGLQRLALKHFKDKLTVLALSNYGSIDNREELGGLLEPLSDGEMVHLAGLLHLRTTYPASCKARIGRTFLTEVLLAMFEKRPTFQDEARALDILPTEQSLFDKSLAQTDAYDGSRPLALPKLNLQYLSVGDFLWRSLVLYRCEAFYGIRQDIEMAVQLVKPTAGSTGETVFTGFSRMAMPVQKLSIAQVVPPLVGENKPSLVKADVAIDFRGVKDNVRRDWEALRPDDAVFLVSINVARQQSVHYGGAAAAAQSAQRLGITSIRTGEVIHGLDSENRRDQSFQRGGRGDSSRGGGRGGQGGRGGRGQGNYQGPGRNFVKHLQLRLDPTAFVDDTSKASDGASDVYDTINLIVRRSGRENNFKPVLDSIRSLVLSDVPLVSWLHEVFLGYGDPAAATYKHMANRIKKVDFRDTFVNWQHLIESLPGKTVEPSDDMTGIFGPPYVLGLVDKPPVTEVMAPTKPASRKRRRDAEPALIADVETLKVSTYKPLNMGPYPVDVPKLNTVRFTPAQTEAIMSGTQPGLTVIVGPPGTGKTDVATQIINTIYHNFPEQRTLLIAHSNQALNQLFAKIVALDIDQRHLLRLGHGEDELGVEGSYSKFGRVEMFLENRNQYLQEVTRLAASMGAPGAHGNSAETAGYFNAVYVEPAWAKFNEVAVFSDGCTAADVVQAFPFHSYFADAPQPLFPADADRDSALDVANGCYRHISKIFSELADARPFEILRRDRDKANYLLTKEARIVAMTSTHAAMRRGEIASLGFHYDNVVVEEAAQITEIEDFIPLALQKADATTGDVPLQRVVLCGDHLQNSPIVQNLAFRHYANLEQSLFSRLVRLGVPTINLDQQGRARPTLADLYRWRYPGLVDLPHVQSAPEFLQANAGFRYDYQFINVPDYRGRGESEPSPHFVQNLGEAEYAVALYQYMRLLGYPASKITILATYAGQRALIRNVLEHRCHHSPVFGMPKTVTTVDKYQGEQNDYVILSLTRTLRVGYLRDIRRLTVALSRARLGLYILGRRDIFEACYELRAAFQVLLQRPDKLALVTGELWPSTRVISEENKAAAGGTLANEVPMEGVEHLGQYVYEMTQTKVRQLQETAAAASASAEGGETTAGSDNEVSSWPGPAWDEEGKDIVAMPDGEDGPIGEADEADDGDEDDGRLDDGDDSSNLVDGSQSRAQEAAQQA